MISSHIPMTCYILTSYSNELAWFGTSQFTEAYGGEHGSSLG